MHEAYALYTTMYTTTPFTHLLEPLARRLGGALPLRPGQVHQVEGGATRARDAPGRVRLAGLEHDGEDGMGAGGLAGRVVVVVVRGLHWDDRYDPIINAPINQISQPMRTHRFMAVSPTWRLR